MNHLNKKILRDLDVANKTVVCHLDLNVLFENGRLINDKRLRASLPTLLYLLNKNAKVVVLSHFGQIKTYDDILSNKYSLKPVADALRNRLQKKANRVVFLPENTGKKVINAVAKMEPRDVLVLENTRYCDWKDGEYIGLEWLSNPDIGKFWASLGDCFVEDAFGISHRRLASNFQTARFAKDSAIGFSIMNETNHIDIALDLPKRPYLALLGGRRIGEKIEAIDVICQRADLVIIGGQIVFTFLHAQGYDVGLNKVDKEIIEDISALLEKYEKKILLCFDFQCNTDFSDTPGIYRKIDEGLHGLYGLDIGPRSLKLIRYHINKAKTILFNGPFGMIENIRNYSKGTTEILKTLARRTEHIAYTILADIDTSNHAEFLDLDQYMNFISSGGTACLTYIAEQSLPGIETVKDISFKNKRIS
ncbi:phosphoglycerate kinase [Ureaplasma canigenitalium]|uniref:phosphoglycerate kinase n=1 Tax=Ureaplasma canigenitalium TaxID=42092 RepID=UPI0004E14AC7|nr:phosphoglycerate kinase [Ureaplasma canigenitalium]